MKCNNAGNLMAFGTKEGGIGIYDENASSSKTITYLSSSKLPQSSVFRLLWIVKDKKGLSYF